MARWNCSICTHIYLPNLLDWANNIVPSWQFAAAVVQCAQCVHHYVIVAIYHSNIWKRTEKPLTIAVGYRITVIKFVNKLSTLYSTAALNIFYILKSRWWHLVCVANSGAWAYSYHMIKICSVNLWSRALVLVCFNMESPIAFDKIRKANTMLHYTYVAKELLFRLIAFQVMFITWIYLW